MSHLHHKVSALIDGELTPNARSRALAHARNCPQCRQEIIETLEVKRRITKLAPVEVSDDLLEVVGSLNPPRLPPPASSRPARLRKVVISAGSMTAAVIVLGYVVGAAPEASQARTVRPQVGEFAAEFADSTGLAPLADPAVEGFTETADDQKGSDLQRNDPRGSPSGLTAGPAQMQPPLRSASQSAEQRAVHLLRRAVSAAQSYAYSGIRVVRSLTPGGNIEAYSVKVRHTPGQGTMFDVPGRAGGGQSEMFVAQSGVTHDGLESRPLGPLVSSYDLDLAGSQSVDGRPTTVISASRGGQVMAKFWIDDNTGLLLRRTMYAGGQVVRWSGYTSIEMRSGGFMAHLPPAVHPMPATNLSAATASALNDKGWTCPERLATDFHLSFLRQVELAGGAMHAEYTDGLSTVSVFEQRGSLDTSTLGAFRAELVGGRAVYVRDGLPLVAVWQSGDTVFTVVTDAPQQIATRLMGRFPHAAVPEPSGLTTRIGRGLTRIASAVAP